MESRWPEFFSWRRRSAAGLVRSVKLKTKSSILVRPIDKIVLLEAAWSVTDRLDCDMLDI